MLRLRSMSLIGAAAVSLLSPVLVASAPAAAARPGPLAPAEAGARGHVVVPSVTGTNHSLNSVSCPDATFCMAVGQFDRGSQVPGLSETLTAGTWTVKPVPSPSRGSNVFANEVSCSSATSCLFVGAHWAGKHGNDTVLAESWNGSKWHIVADTGVAGAAFSVVNDVACPTAKLCLAIGDAGSTKRFQDTAYTWRNGTTWQRITVPHPGRARSSELGGLACSDAAHCMAVGNYTSAAGKFLPFAALWHSGHWRLITIQPVKGQRETFFQGISCPTATKCVAVGNTEDETKGEFFHALAEVWSGGKWHAAPLRKAPSVLIGASCPTANRCFASGYTFPSTRSYAHQLIEAWNGHTWTTQHPAQTAGYGGSLQHVSCVSPVLCEAVGLAFFPNVSNSDQAITEVWKGHNWLGQVTPNP
jgi:hypothetical protein